MNNRFSFKVLVIGAHRGEPAWIMQWGRAPLHYTEAEWGQIRPGPITMRYLDHET